jgi:hypothetical protein
VPAFHIADSAFGSFNLVPRLHELKTSGVYSMPASTKKWLWSTLSYGLGVDEGRTAIIPATDSSPAVIASVFNVISDQTQKEHFIKTLATGWECTFPEESEDFVVRLSGCRERDGQLEFKTHVQDGHVEWKLGSAFFSDDGVINAAFLQYVSSEQLATVLNIFPLSTLSTFCIGQKKAGGGTKPKLLKRLVKLYIHAKVLLLSFLLL